MCVALADMSGQHGITVKRGVIQDDGGGWCSDENAAELGDGWEGNAALQLVTELISVNIAAKASTIIMNDRLLKLNTVLDAHFSESKENLANTLAEARKQLVRGEVNRDAELADLSDNVLGRVHRVVVLVPA